MKVSYRLSNIRFRRSTRRRAVVFAHLILVTALAAGAMVSFNVAVLLTGVFVLLSFWLAYATGFLESLPNRYLDERQRALRDRAHRFALVLANVYVGGIVLTVIFANAWYQEPFFVLLVFILGLAVLNLVPSYIAWLEPDPLTEEVSRASNA